MAHSPLQLWFTTLLITQLVKTGLTHSSTDSESSRLVHTNSYSESKDLDKQLDLKNLPLLHLRRLDFCSSPSCAWLSGNGQCDPECLTVGCNFDGGELDFVTLVV